MTKSIIGGVFALIMISILFAFSPLVSVSNGTMGIVTVGGDARANALAPGFHLISPFAHVTELSIQPLKADAKGEAASKDLQAVHTSMTVNYKLNTDKVVDFYKAIGIHNFEERLLSSAAQDAFKAATSKYRAEELIAQRDQVRALTKENLVKSINELTNSTVIITDVFFTNFDFNPGFRAAIEAAVTAEKQAIAEKNKLAIVDYQAKQRVIEAEGTAKIMLVTRQQATPEFLRLKELEIEAARVAKWNGALPTQMFSGTPTAFMNVGK